MPEDLSAHESVARSEARDEHGHFVHTNPPIHAPTPRVEPQTSNPISQFASEHINVSRTPSPAKSDDLIDVHVGNPLAKITRLLEDIKRQKAFSFTLKGSLGIAGVALALGVFGVFGSNQLLCSHGKQTEIGIVKTLQFGEAQKSTIPFIGNLLDRVSPGQVRHRVVLIKSDDSVVRLTGKALINNPSSLTTNGVSVIATGDYNSCAQTLNITDPSGVELNSQGTDKLGTVLGKIDGIIQD